MNKVQKITSPVATVVYSCAQIVYRSVFALDAAHEGGLAYLNMAATSKYDPWPDLTQAEFCAAHMLTGAWEDAHRSAKEAVAFQKRKSLPPMGKTGWFETEALLRGGDEDLARAEVERVATAIGNNRRYRLPLLRSRAVLAQWDGDASQAIVHLEAALALAREIGLPGEVWPILGELGKLYAEQEEDIKAQGAYKEAAVIINRLAATIDEEELKMGFLTAVPTRTILQQSKPI